MKKMAQLLSECNNDPVTHLPINLYLQDLLERLTLGTGTDKLQGLSDTDVCIEVATYNLWKLLNG